MNGSSTPLNRRQAFALAAALTLTVLTGGAAITGLRNAAPAPHRQAPIVQLAQPPAPAPPPEESD